MENPNPDEKPTEKNLGEMLMEKAGALKTSETTEEAGRKMQHLDTHVLPVSEDRKLVGMMTDKYPQHSVAAHGHDPKTVRVGEQMSRELIFCYEDEDRSKADALMEEKQLRYLPVVDRQMRIVGVLERDEVKTVPSRNAED